MRVALMAVLLAAACASGGEDGPKIDSGGVNPGDPDSSVGPPMCATECTGGDDCCNVGGSWFCLSTTADVNNCGGCGAQCDTRVNEGDSTDCQGSQCVCGFSPACGDGFTCCTEGAVSTCEDLQTDPLNCGSCGNSCGASPASCVDGQCTCGGETCTGGDQCCGSGCTDTLTDPNNCGNCGTVCSGDFSACVNGDCGCPGGGSTCASDAVAPRCCGSGCIDICGDDANNCGGCAAVCSGLCISGFCFGEITSGTSDPTACLVP